MKRLNYLVNGLAALALIVLFSQCTGKADNQTATTSGQASGELTGMKIAYVEIDTLLAQYNFCVDLNEGMVKKSENVRMTINQKARELDKQKQEFQTKYQNNAYLSPERAQQEYNRIAKLEQDLQALSNKLQSELMSENEKNSLQLIECQQHTCDYSRTVTDCCGFFLHQEFTNSPFEEQTGSYRCSRDNQRTQSEEIERYKKCRNQCNKHTIHILFHAVTTMDVG